MFCTRCGTKNPDNSAHCYNCGQNMATAPRRPPQTKPASLREIERTPATTPPLSLDPRKSPWKRGDLCTRGFKQTGFVLNHTPEYLEVRWMGNRTVEQIPAENIDDLLRVAHADSRGDDGRTHLETLESLEALSRIQDGIAERMKRVKNESEKRELDYLTRRLFAANKCEWDETNTTVLWRLFLEPENVGRIFKIRDRIHRVFCKRHEQLG